MKHALLALAVSAAALTGCDSTEPDPGSVIDHLETHLTPARASYPVGDTVRASVVALSREGTLVPMGTPIWRSLTPSVASVAPTGLITALASGEATIEVEVDGVTTRLQLPIRGILHTTRIDVSQTWRVADTPHVVRGYLGVHDIFGVSTEDTTVLTIEPGVTVRFRPRSGLYFGDIEPGALRIPAGTNGVVMEGDSAARGSWVGLSFQGRGRSELRNLTIRHCGAKTPSDATLPCLNVSSGAQILIDGVTVSDAHDGVSISHGIMPGSRVLSIHNTDGYTATISPDVVATFPRGGQFSGNSENEIRITGGNVEQSAEWTPAGLPWRLTGGVVFQGPAEPLLSLPAGFTIRADPAGSLAFATGGLVAGAIGGAPVVLESTGSGWGGIETAHGGQSALRNVVLRDCGSTSAACLRVGAFDENDAGIVMEDVTIRGARSAGIYFDIWGHFRAGSRNITVTESAGVPFDVTPEGVTSIPPGNYRFNGTDAIRVRGGLIWQSATWRNLGVAYLAPHGITIDSSIEPPTLTLEPGVVFRMAVGTTFTVGIGMLHAVGTAAEPIVFSSATPGVAGSWMGIELQNWDTPAMRLDHVEIADAGAGPPGFAGALRLYVDPGGVLRNSTIRRSPSCGIFLFDGAWADDYSDPAFGNTFVDIAGPALCQPPP